MIGFINFIFGRLVVFTFVGLLVFVGSLVFAGGDFSPSLFWKIYLGVEGGLLLTYLVLSVRDAGPRYPMGVGRGTPIGLDGKPPWAAEEDARLEREAREAAAREDSN